MPTSKGEDRSTVVCKFIEAGADVNMASKRGVTPLMNAAFYGHEENLALLLERGANVNKSNKKWSYTSNKCQLSGK